jgi:hypothetical protein
MIAAVGLVTASSLSSDSAQSGAELCPSFDIDPNTGSLREKGRVPCGSLVARNNRFELVRDAFRGR